MRILLANKFFFPKGGAETVFFQERDYLRKSGHEVIDFSMKHPQNLPSKYQDYFVREVSYDPPTNGGSLRRLPGKVTIAANLIYNRDAVGNLKSLISHNCPDIAHLHNIYHQITPAIIKTLKNAGAKVVLTLHDYKIICPNYLLLNAKGRCDSCQGKHFIMATLKRCKDRSFPKSALLTLEAYWHRWIKTYEYVDLFLCPSRFMADLVSRLRADERKVRLLRNGVNVEAHSDTVTDYGYVLYFGRISREKGIRTLLESQALWSIDAPLKIVGDGPLLKEVKTQFRKAEFLGPRNGDALKDLIKNAACVVAPSECYENCSMSVLEGMAFGKPVIGSMVGGIPEQIEDGQTGFIFAPGNAAQLAQRISLVLADRDLRRRLGQRASQKLIQEYSLTAHCAGLIRIYEELLAG